MSKVSSRKAPFVISVALTVSVVVAGIYFNLRSRRELPQEAGTAPAVARDADIRVGGISRPYSDLVVNRGDIREQIYVGDHVNVRQQDKAGTKGPAADVRIDKSTNANVRNAIEAFETGNHPERLTPTVMPKKFDQQAYDRDATAYLDVVEPGRVWQSAQPGPDVIPLRPRSGLRQSLRQGESVRLAVQTEAGAPVTFTAFDYGVFQNRLPSITVAADDSGLAEASFTAVTGTLNEANVLAGGPLSSGQVRFMLHVAPSTDRVE